VGARVPAGCCEAQGPARPTKTCRPTSLIPERPARQLSLHARDGPDIPFNLGARRLLIAAYSGGSNSTRTRAWKAELAALALETGLEITACHFPPGTQCRCLSY
jgi:Rhodopirellula transposase DDE domain